MHLRLFTVSRVGSNLQLNQLPKRAPINPNSKLKFGTASAKIQLTSHAPVHIAPQLPKLFQLLVDATLVPFHTRKYMYLVATEPLTTPATMIVGSAMPKQILLTSGDAEPRAGEATSGPA